jgi:hypothetical protein
VNGQPVDCRLPGRVQRGSTSTVDNGQQTCHRGRSGKVLCMGVKLRDQVKVTREEERMFLDGRAGTHAAAMATVNREPPPGVSAST